ncbi:hypothetical protein PM082_006565 [Marasmius tenuissimus]|nr:hypothetical protein PM082_006565 [Marasmius tenuissimus]
MAYLGAHFSAPDQAQSPLIALDSGIRPHVEDGSKLFQEMYPLRLAALDGHDTKWTIVVPSRSARRHILAVRTGDRYDGVKALIECPSVSKGSNNLSFKQTSGPFTTHPIRSELTLWPFASTRPLN